MSAIGVHRDAWIHEGIASVPRIRLALTPTPHEYAPNLSQSWAALHLHQTRRSNRGIAFGGNKLRNLEFRFALTMAERPDTVIVGLDIQSNSARQSKATCWSITCSAPR